jgi:hypothetical protein
METGLAEVRRRPDRRCRRVGRLVPVLLTGLTATVSPQQVANQRFEVVPRATHATVGDTISLSFRVRLDPLDLLYDTIPAPVQEPPPGTRVLAAEKLHRAENRDWVGRALIAFYRTGRQTVPVFGLPFMRGVKGVTRATLTSDSVFVDIDSVAPPGNPSLKDIREPASAVPDVGRYLPAVAGLLVLMTAALTRRRRARPDSPAAQLPAVAVPGPSPYDRAMERLGGIDGESCRHYAAVADTLRAYLTEAHGARALTRSTRELGAALLADTPAPVARSTLELLAEADLVKFARARRTKGEGERALGEARRQLLEWHAVERGGVAGEQVPGTR